MHIDNAPAASTSGKLERLLERFTASSLFRNSLLIASGTALVSLAGAIIVSTNAASSDDHSAYSSAFDFNYPERSDCIDRSSAACIASAQGSTTLDATANTRDPGAALNALAKALPRDGSTYQVSVKVTRKDMARPITKELY